MRKLFKELSKLLCSPWTMRMKVVHSSGNNDPNF